MGILNKITRKKIGAVSFFLLIIYGCVVLYFVLFSDRLGRVEGYSTYRYNLIPFAEIRRFILYRNYVSTEAFLLNLMGNLLVFFPVGMLIPLWRTKENRFYPDFDIYIFVYALYREPAACDEGRCVRCGRSADEHPGRTGRLGLLLSGA